METGVKIDGGKVDREAVEAVARSVVTIFTAAHETRMDQKTVRAALGLVGQMGSIHGIHLDNCQFDG